jgi:methionyl-tRNA formyltransferase
VKMRPQNVVALLVGDPHAPELWTLKNLASVAGSLKVVSAENGTGVSSRKRLRRLIREHGVIRVASRVLAGKLIGKLEERRELEDMERLFDGEHLREWWAHCGISPITVPHLNHEYARSVIAALEPDIIVRVSGGILKREVFGLACTAALNIHHGVAPRIRGMWSIPWGIVEGRTDWIGATVHLIDDGIDTGCVLWRGSPQIAPGDTATELFFRAHLEAVEALVRVIEIYTRGDKPSTHAKPEAEASVYRSAPGLAAWIRFLYLLRGRRSPAILAGALKC